MPNAKTVVSAAASIVASAMLIRTIANEFIPNEIREYFFSNFHTLSCHFSSQLTIIIEESQGLSPNEVYNAAKAYLGTKLTPMVQRLNASKDKKDKKLEITVDRNQEVTNVFENVEVKWRLLCQRVNSSNHNKFTPSESRHYELSFHKKHKEKVLNSYLPHVIERSKAIKAESKATKLYQKGNVDYRSWGPDPLTLDHPMNFNHLAMDSELKKALMDDLDEFKKGKEFYRRIGKPWKRGYLLYGPPGTGKSSLIAAMANHLNYDIYYLDLTDVGWNGELKDLLLTMTSKSILVIEDIDCSIKMENRDSDEPVDSDSNKVTLSGLLNFFDGLWSCCGDEHVIVITTNYKDQLDPALLRPGRMDMHIHMSYCTDSAFRQLALNYLGIGHHQLFEEIDGLLGEVQVTPAEVTGELMKSSFNVETSLHGLVGFLQQKKIDKNNGEMNKKIDAQEEKEDRGKEREGKPKRREGTRVRGGFRGRYCFRGRYGRGRPL